MKVLILTVLALVVFASGSKISEEAFYRARAARVEANLNNYFDSLLENLKQFVIENGLDPLALPDQVQEFTVQGIIIEWHGELDLTNGQLKDISTLNRQGDVIANYENKQLDVKATIGFGDLKFYFDYLAQIMDIGPKGEVDGTVTDLTLELEILVDLSNFTASLKDFQIEHTGSVHVELHGNGLLDIIANAIVGIVTTIFKDVVMQVVEGEVRKVLEDALAGFQLGTYMDQLPA